MASIISRNGLKLQCYNFFVGRHMTNMQFQDSTRPQFSERCVRESKFNPADKIPLNLSKLADNSMAKNNNKVKYISTSLDRKKINLKNPAYVRH